MGFFDFTKNIPPGFNSDGTPRSFGRRGSAFNDESESPEERMKKHVTDLKLAQELSKRKKHGNTRPATTKSSRR